MARSYTRLVQIIQVTLVTARGEMHLIVGYSEYSGEMHLIVGYSE